MVVRKKRHPGKILLFKASKMFSKGRPRNHLENDHVEQIAAIPGSRSRWQRRQQSSRRSKRQGRLQSLAEPVCVHLPLIGLGALCVRLMSLLLRFTRSSCLVVNLVIRRDWATLLLAISGFSLIAPTVSAGWGIQTAGRLPSPWCPPLRQVQGHRRIGYGHHGTGCKMPFVPDREGPSSRGARATALSTSQRICAAIVTHPAAQPQTEALYRISYSRAGQKRGPPPSLTNRNGLIWSRSSRFTQRELALRVRGVKVEKMAQELRQ
jgi:hypothetical protein